MRVPLAGTARRLLKLPWLICRTGWRPPMSCQYLTRRGAPPTIRYTVWVPRTSTRAPLAVAWAGWGVGRSQREWWWRRPGLRAGGFFCGAGGLGEPGGPEGTGELEAVPTVAAST